MVAASFADSVSDCADVYVPPGGVAVVVGGVVSGILMVYDSVFGDSSFPAVSFAKNLSVVVVPIGIGIEYVVLDVVGVVPSVV